MSQNLYILLASSNSSEHPLPTLEDEHRSIKKIFENLAGNPNNNIHLRDDLNFEVTSLVNTIRNFRDVLRVFHFAGHANGEKLLFDAENANGEGVAKLLGQAPKLKLVFLNGCATKGHVKRLLEAGIPAVIATSAKIEDDSANQFSKYFYEDFASKKRTLGVSFDAAVSSMLVLDSYKKIEIMKRDTGDSFSSDDDQVAPWGLYINPNVNKEQILAWKLEQEDIPVVPPSLEKSIFISYHYTDDSIFKKLKIHLNPRTLIIKDSNSLTAGDEISNSLESQINKTQTILLLLSAMYIADEEKYQEREAIKALKAKGKRIIPILTSACEWDLEFGNVVILPRDKQPIDEKSNQDKVLYEITKEIKQLL
jgi:CHAT domain/TIR domain